MYVADPASALSSESARAAFVAAMQTPAPYAALHDVHVPIRCVETHVSWVFLTGRYAYKVKKPVRLPFLDYSTAARRAWLCREELRLNRRHAPDLYVDTVPIAGRAEAPQVGASGEAFEHALRMQQFEPEAELSQLLRTRAIASADIATFAERLARMHADATPADNRTPYGTPHAVHKVTRENFAVLAGWLPDATRRLDTDLQATLERAFERLEPRMHARRRDGRVREGHGDLHCGNVVLWQGRLVAFDGLEFDPALRFIDVANDLAFLSMDLAVHGRADLRRTLVDRWTEASGDYGAVELLPYYEPARALVRAKIAALQIPRAASVRQQAATTRLACGYLEWANARASRVPPMLVAMVGLSGSGKTWLARRIAETIGALHIRSDVERKRLAGLGPLESSRSAPDAGIYTPAFNERTYARLFECARACLGGGESVVMDAANLRRHERGAFVQLAAEVGARARLVHCDAPTDVLRERISRRRVAGADASEATLDVLDRQPSWWEPLTESESAICEVVTTTEPSQVESTLQRLATAAAKRGAS